MFGAIRAVLAFLRTRTTQSDDMRNHFDNQSRRGGRGGRGETAVAA